MKIDTFENGLKSAAFWKRIVLIAGAYWNGGSYQNKGGEAYYKEGAKSKYYGSVSIGRVNTSY